ncbi:MAG: hypothetical protein AB7P69_02760 [Candidatus Binatia bacterium]
MTIHSFGDATGRVASLGNSPCVRFLAPVAHHVGVKISQLDCTEGHFHWEALAHLRAVYWLGHRSKLEEKRLDEMERFVRTWNMIFGVARRILHVYG